MSHLPTEELAADQVSTDSRPATLNEVAESIRCDAAQSSGEYLDNSVVPFGGE